MEKIYRKTKNQKDFLIPQNKISKNKNNKILFLVNVHGDEPVGQHILSRLIKKFGTQKFDWIIANPEAVTKYVRYIDCDLNRSAPGNPSSDLLEERLASELVAIVSQYRVCIDIHQTRANNRTVLILPKISTTILEISESIGVRDVLFWSPKIDAVNKPILNFASCGIGFEVGTKNYFDSKVEQSVTTLSNFICKDSEKIARKQRFYLVGEKIRENNLIVGSVLRDFVPYRSADGKFFVPLLFGRHANNIGYKMRKIDRVDVLKYSEK